jgi:hypothetical protein
VHDERRGHVFHVDSLDLYSARARGVFCRQAAGEVGLAGELVARDLGRVLLVCEERAEEVIRAAQEPARPELALTDAEREQAMGLLTDPQLVERVVADFAVAGVVGEQVNCLVGYLAAVSRKLDRPLAVIVQSLRSAGSATRRLHASTRWPSKSSTKASLSSARTSCSWASIPPPMEKTVS